ncbi:MAG: bifunctional folylpolyglutamate synthase/dihydrofolate synthase [Verrucomicrobiae bacterium]|nr:bifunctional folylpolyglutamate synthase/dihydrofolate synthase [Verrucomicrobiae bacterium]
MTYREALEYLYGLQRFGLRLGLDVPRRLAGAFGCPQDGLKFLHVAGTNGKGSTCAFLESACRASGRRVGLFTSPHLVSFRERIQIDRQPIPEDAVARWVRQLRLVTDTFPTDQHPTFFEVVTVLALLWFREQGCDLVVWETGMGGRLDATNIVSPLATLVTPIGWDHQQWLGNTLAAIAGEKAGIFKPGVPALTTALEPEALDVLHATATACHAPWRHVRPGDPETVWLHDVHLPLPGPHQELNAALAVAAVRTLKPILPITDSDLRRGLESTHWPGRFEVYSENGRVRVLDGAHNPPAFEALADTLDLQFPGQSYSLVLGMLADKDPVAAVARLVPGARRTVVVPVRTPRSIAPEVLARHCADVPGGAGPVACASSLAEALALLANEDLVVITGSLYLVGEAMELRLGTTDSERGLNDWSPSR